MFLHHFSPLTDLPKSPLYRRVQNETQTFESRTNRLLHGSTEIHERRHQSHGRRHPRSSRSVLQPSRRLVRCHTQRDHRLSRCELQIFTISMEQPKLVLAKFYRCLEKFPKINGIFHPEVGKQKNPKKKKKPGKFVETRTFFSVLSADSAFFSKRFFLLVIENPNFICVWELFLSRPRLKINRNFHLQVENSFF